jgi:hypothetical protein
MKTLRAFFTICLLLGSSASFSQGQNFSFDNSKTWKWSLLISATATAQLDEGDLRVRLPSIRVRVPEDYKGSTVGISSYTVALVRKPTSSDKNLPVIARSSRVIVAESLRRGDLKILPGTEVRIPLPNGKLAASAYQLLIDFVIQDSSKLGYSYAYSAETINSFLVREFTVTPPDKAKNKSSNTISNAAGQVFTIDNNDQQWAVNTLGALTLSQRDDQLTVNSQKLVLSVRPDFPIRSKTIDSVSVDVVTRNKDGQGWAVISKTRDIPISREVQRGTATEIAITDERIPFAVASTFPYNEHWVVVTARVSTQGQRPGTVHAHSTERLSPMLLAATKIDSRGQSNTPPDSDKPQEVLFAPVNDSVISHLGSAELSVSGPFLVLTFSDYLIRSNDRHHGKSTQLHSLRFRLVSKAKQPDGTYRIRESEPYSIKDTLTDRLSKSVTLPQIKIPIDGIPFNQLGEFRLVGDLRLGDGRGGVASEAHPRIDPSRLVP